MDGIPQQRYKLHTVIILMITGLGYIHTIHREYSSPYVISEELY
jgi:hypothetical protein